MIVVPHLSCPFLAAPFGFLSVCLSRLLSLFSPLTQADITYETFLFTLCTRKFRGVALELRDWSIREVKCCAASVSLRCNCRECRRYCRSDSVRSSLIPVESICGNAIWSKHNKNHKRTGERRKTGQRKRQGEQMQEEGSRKTMRRWQNAATIVTMVNKWMKIFAFFLKMLYAVQQRFTNFPWKFSLCLPPITWAMSLVRTNGALKDCMSEWQRVRSKWVRGRHGEPWGGNEDSRRSNTTSVLFGQCQ